MRINPMPQDALGFTPQSPDYQHAPAPTVPPAPQSFTRGFDPAASDTNSAGARVAVVASGSGQQRVIGDGSAVVLGSPMYLPQYTPLRDVAFPLYDATHRTIANLMHPPAPTHDATPRPDWNPFATLRNWPMQAMAGLRTQVFGGPRSPTLKGRNV